LIGARCSCVQFSDLLVNQMEATLEGQDITVRIRSSKYDEKIMGPRGASLPIDKQAPRGALLRSDLAWSGK
jgi:hypothetical protein